MNVLPIIAIIITGLATLISILAFLRTIWKREPIIISLTGDDPGKRDEKGTLHYGLMGMKGDFYHVEVAGCNLIQFTIRLERNGNKLDITENINFYYPKLEEDIEMTILADLKSFPHSFTYEDRHANKYSQLVFLNKNNRAEISKRKNLTPLKFIWH